MKIKHFTVNNFLSFKAAFLKLEDRGLVLINGEVDEGGASSNGAGKSSVLDAVCWCLFGTTARGISGDDVVNEATGKDCSVRLFFEQGDLTYEVIRYRRHTAGKNALYFASYNKQEEVEADLTLGTNALTQARIEKVLGCSYEIFKAAVYAGQENFLNLPEMTDKQLKLVVEEAARTTVLEDAYQNAREYLRQVQEKLDKKETLQRRDEQKVAELESKSDRMLSLENDWDAERDSKLSDLHNSHMALLDEAERLRRNIGDVAEKENRLIAAVRHIADCIIEATKPDDDELKVERELKDKQRVVDSYKNQIESRRYTCQLKSSRRKKLEEKKISKCYGCGRPLDQNGIEEAIRLLDEEIENALIAYNFVEDQYRREGHALEILEEQRTTRRAARPKIENILKAREQAQWNLDVFRDKIYQRELKLDELRRVERDINTLSLAKSPYEALLSELVRELDDAKEAVSTRSAHIHKLKEEIELEEAAVDVFSPAGARAHILDTVTPYLNERTAYYLNILSDGKLEAVWTTLSKTAKGEQREKFSIDVPTRKGGFAALSGGEKYKVRISTSLALQDLVASKAEKPIKLFMVDELDKPLDASGAERFVTLLQEKAVERGTVLVISHNEAVRDCVSESILVKKQGGVSCLS